MEKKAGKLYILAISFRTMIVGVPGSEVEKHGNVLTQVRCLPHKISACGMHESSDNNGACLKTGQLQNDGGSCSANHMGIQNSLNQIIFTIDKVYVIRGLLSKPSCVSNTQITAPVYYGRLLSDRLSAGRTSQGCCQDKMKDENNVALGPLGRKTGNDIHYKSNFNYILP